MEENISGLVDGLLHRRFPDGNKGIMSQYLGSVNHGTISCRDTTAK